SAVSRKLPPAATKESRTACEPASSAVHPKVLVPRLIGKMDSSVPGISTCVIVLLKTFDVDGLARTGPRSGSTPPRGRIFRHRARLRAEPALELRPPVRAPGRRRCDPASPAAEVPPSA